MRTKTQWHLSSRHELWESSICIEVQYNKRAYALGPTSLPIYEKWFSAAAIDCFNDQWLMIRKNSIPKNQWPFIFGFCTIAPSAVLDSHSMVIITPMRAQKPDSRLNPYHVWGSRVYRICLCIHRFWMVKLDIYYDAVQYAVDTLSAWMNRWLWLCVYTIHHRFHLNASSDSWCGMKQFIDIHWFMILWYIRRPFIHAGEKWGWLSGFLRKKVLPVYSTITCKYLVRPETLQYLLEPLAGKIFLR